MKGWLQMAKGYSVVCIKSMHEDKLSNYIEFNELFVQKKALG